MCNPLGEKKEGKKKKDEKKARFANKSKVIPVLRLSLGVFQRKDLKNWQEKSLKESSWGLQEKNTFRDFLTRVLKQIFHIHLDLFQHRSLFYLASQRLLDIVRTAHINKMEVSCNISYLRQHYCCQNMYLLEMDKWKGNPSILLILSIS